MATFGFTRRGYIAVTINLATANTAYNILTLINAVLATEPSAGGVQASGAAREFNIQSLPTTSFSGAAAGNTGNIAIGDSLISGTRMGYVLGPAQSRVYRSNINNVDVGSLYAMGDAANQKLLVELVNG